VDINLIDMAKKEDKKDVVVIEGGLPVGAMNEELIAQASEVEDGDEGKIVKTIETTTIEIPKEEDATKSFFKAMGKRHDEENHWFDYKPKNRDLSKNKNKHIIY
jgi:hypothetical protein